MSWQPIETAPKDGTIIIGLFRKYDILSIGLIVWAESDDGISEWFDAFDFDGDGKYDWPVEESVTHWLPSPLFPSCYTDEQNGK